VLVVTCENTSMKTAGYNQDLSIYNTIYLLLIGHVVFATEKPYADRITPFLLMNVSVCVCVNLFATVIGSLG